MGGDDKKKYLTYKKESPNNTNNNFNLITTIDGNNTNNTIKKDIINNNNKIFFNTEPIKAKNQLDDNIENWFIKKKTKIYKPPTTTDKKIISFQRQGDQQIIEFYLFEEKLIFKDINRSYLQEVDFDDGDDSSEEQIENGKILLSQELEESTNELYDNLKKNQKKPLLSREIRFKADPKKD